MEFKFGISELSISAFNFLAWVWTTKAEVKGETHGSDIHINNIQVRVRPLKSIMLHPEPYSSSGNHHPHSHWTSTICWHLHESRRDTDLSNTAPVLREFTAMRLGNSLGENRKSPWNPGSRWKQREMGQLSEGRADYMDHVNRSFQK